MKTKMPNRKLRPRKYSGKFARDILTGLHQLHHAVSTGDFSKATVRTVEIPDPAKYGPREVRALRESLDVSQGIFAAMIGVSLAQVGHWEHGLREPSALARRLFDKIRENPAAYRKSLVQRRSA